MRASRKKYLTSGTLDTIMINWIPHNVVNLSFDNVLQSFSRDS